MSDRALLVDDETAIAAAEKRTVATFEDLRSTHDQARVMGLNVSGDEAALSRSIAALHARRE